MSVKPITAKVIIEAIGMRTEVLVDDELAWKILRMALRLEDSARASDNSQVKDDVKNPKETE